MYVTPGPFFGSDHLSRRAAQTISVISGTTNKLFSTSNLALWSLPTHTLPIQGWSLRSLKSDSYIPLVSRFGPSKFRILKNNLTLIYQTMASQIPVYGRPEKQFFIPKTFTRFGFYHFFELLTRLPIYHYTHAHTHTSTRTHVWLNTHIYVTPLIYIYIYIPIVNS